MNLVDAIRRASATQAVCEDTSPADNTVLLHLPLNEEDSPVELTDNENPMSERAGNFVRIELFLSPEQINGLLKDTVGAHRSIMTAKEVANLLRTTTHNVEKLANEGKLPGFLLEDSWRFHKSAMEDWLQTHGSADVA